MQKLNKKDALSIVNITLRLLIVCAAVALLVASVNFITKDRIEAYELEKTTSALDSVFAKAELSAELSPEYKKIDVELTASVTGIYEAYYGEQLAGYGILCSPTGFKDAIKMMVAFDSENTVIAVRIISLSETTGIGDKVMKDPSFTKQFEGKKNSITLGSDGVNAIAGSTVSSKAVTKGVNDAISMIKIYKSGAANKTEGEGTANG